MSINLIRNGGKRKKQQSVIVRAFHNSNSQRDRKKNQKSYALLLTSKQVYKLIQRAVILKIFYV